MIEFIKPYNYYDYKLENQLQKLYILYLKNKSKEEALKKLSSILHIIYKLRNERNINFNVYISYLIIILFHKRQYKNDKINKNSKEIFYESILLIYDYDYKLVNTLIYNDLPGVYGYDKDYLQIWKKVILRMKTNYKIKNPNQTRTKWFYHFFKKYNPLIVAISSVMLYKKNRDLQIFDEFLKRNSDEATKNNITNNWSKFGLAHLINDSSKNKHQKILTFFNSISKYYDFNNLNNININIRMAFISKVCVWLPRERRNRDIFWYIRPYRRNILNIRPNLYNQVNNASYEVNYISYDKDKSNFKFKFTSCFNYFVLYDKISYKNIESNIIHNIDKKKFRTTSSILNILKDTPQIYMCRNKFQEIKFSHCGSKFINKNKKIFNLENNKKIKTRQKLDRKLCSLNYITYMKCKSNKDYNINNNESMYNQLSFFFKGNKTDHSKIIKTILNHKNYEIIYSILNEYFL